MDPDIFTAYIYQIYDHWDGLRYIGSTTKNIHERLKAHESYYKRYNLRTTQKYYTSYEVLRNGDYDISLLKVVEVSSMIELRIIEGEFIVANDCVNKNIAGRTNKQYHKQNKEKRNIQCRSYYVENQEALKERKTSKVNCECGRMISKNEYCQTPHNIKSY